MYADWNSIWNFIKVIDYNPIIAWTGLITAIVSIFALSSENRKWRFSLSIDLLFRLDDKYDTSVMKAFRRNAAKLLLQYQDNNKNKEYRDSLDEVLDFFEMIGNLVQRRAINDEMVWHNFSNSIFSYWYFAEKSGYIKEIREQDKSIWEDISYLRKAISKFGDFPPENKLIEFLESEMRLK